MNNSNPAENNPHGQRLPVLVNTTTNERYTLESSSIKIGRAPENEIVLEEDGYASGDHARFYWQDGWWVEDLMSSNGTRVNDQLITQPTQLAPGDLIKVGRTMFRIE